MPSDDTDNTPHAPYGVPTDDETDRSGEQNPHRPYGVPGPVRVYFRWQRLRKLVEEIDRIAYDRYGVPSHRPPNDEE